MNVFAGSLLPTSILRNYLHEYLPKESAVSVYCISQQIGVLAGTKLPDPGLESPFRLISRPYSLRYATPGRQRISLPWQTSANRPPPCGRSPWPNNDWLPS